MGRKPSLLLVSVFRLRERKGPTRRIQIYHLRGSATVTAKTHIEIKTMIEKGIAYERKARRPQVGLIQNRRRHRGPPFRIHSYAPYRRSWHLRRRVGKATQSSGDIFADLFPDADELDLIKLRAAFLIGKTINKYGLSQRAAAVKLGVAQPDVSRILNGLVDRFTLEKLVWKPMASSFAAAWSKSNQGWAARGYPQWRPLKALSRIVRRP
jgi:predicted XRE-type DNA-binding protein